MGRLGTHADAIPPLGIGARRAGFDTIDVQSRSFAPWSHLWIPYLGTRASSLFVDKCDFGSLNAEVAN